MAAFQERDCPGRSDRNTRQCSCGWAGWRPIAWSTVSPGESSTTITCSPWPRPWRPSRGLAGRRFGNPFKAWIANPPRRDSVERCVILSEGCRSLLLPLALLLTAAWQALIWLNYQELAKWGVPVLLIAATAGSLGLLALRGSWWAPCTDDRPVALYRLALVAGHCGSRRYHGRGRRTGQGSHRPARHRGLGGGCSWIGRQSKRSEKRESQLLVSRLSRAEALELLQATAACPLLISPDEVFGLPGRFVLYSSIITPACRPSTRHRWSCVQTARHPGLHPRSLTLPGSSLPPLSLHEPRTRTCSHSTRS